MQERKSIFRLLLTATLTLAILGALFYLFYWYFSLPRCNSPILFSVQSVDYRFKIDKAQTEDVSREAAKRFNEESNHNLFDFNQNSQLKINLVYDSRQAEIDAIKSQANSLQDQKSNLDEQNAQFESLLSDYKSRLEKYNSEVEYYNSHGGAPKEQYEALNKELENLKTLQSRLKSMAEELNRQSDLYNADVDILQENIERSANKIITEGEYDPNSKTINIYTYGGKDELKFVLMHEMGHALDLEHVSDPKALMNEMIRDQNINSPILTQDDLNELERVCNFQKKFIMPTLQDLQKLIFGREKQT